MVPFLAEEAMIVFKEEVGFRQGVEHLLTEFAMELMRIIFHTNSHTPFHCFTLQLH